MTVTKRLLNSASPLAAAALVAACSTSSGDAPSVGVPIGSGGGGGPINDTEFFPADATGAALDPAVIASWENAEYTNNFANFDAIGVAEAYASRNGIIRGGDGVRVAILGAGLDATHPDLAGQIAQSFAIDTRPYALEDQLSTQVGGVVGANRNGDSNPVAGTDIHGVAFGADLIDVRFAYDVNGQPFFPEAGLAAAILSAAGVAGSFQGDAGDQAVYNSLPGAESDVIVIGVGSFLEDAGDRVQTAIEAAAAADKIVVIAAGQLGGVGAFDGTAFSFVSTPGNPAITAAGDPDSQNNVIIATSFEANPDHDGGAPIDSNNPLYIPFDDGAPGLNGASACRGANDFCVGVLVDGTISTRVAGADPSLFGAVEGESTAIAAAYVAGAAAILKATFPSVSSQEIISRIFRTSSTSSLARAASESNDVEGRGLINLPLALAPLGPLGFASVSAFSQDVTFADAQWTAPSAFGAGFADAAFAGAIAFDEDGFPFPVDLAGQVRMNEDDQILNRIFFSAPSADLVSGSVPGVAKYSIARSNLAPVDAERRRFMGEDELGDRVTGRARVKIANGLSIDMAMATDGRLGFAGETANPALVNANPARAPYAALMEEADGVALIARAPLGFTLSGAYHRTTDRYELVGNESPTAAFQAFNDRNAQSELMSFAAARDVKIGKMAFNVTARYGRLNEEGSALGGFGRGAFEANTADTEYVEAALSGFAAGFALYASYTTGRTEQGASYFLDNWDDVETDAFVVALARGGVFARRDTLSFAVSQPLTARSGSADVALPVGREKDGTVIVENRRLDLDAARPVVVETTYAREIKGPWTASASAFTAQTAGEEGQLGAILRLGARF
ncbi:MAG: S8 family serine peptidase [Pseudomonadota bacterium]